MRAQRAALLKAGIFSACLNVMQLGDAALLCCHLLPVFNLPIYILQVPEHVLAHVQQHGTSSWEAEDVAEPTPQADSSSSSSSSSSERQPPSQGRQLHQAIPIRANALNVRPGLRASAARPASWATASITPSVRGFGIPKTFLGISHEWTNVEELNQPGAYLQLIQDLTAYRGGPLVVRIGGGSTDQQTAPAPASTWNELRQLQYKTGEPLQPKQAGST
jgi:hypothetical protein